jgi:hypothetical protein
MAPVLKGKSIGLDQKTVDRRQVAIVAQKGFSISLRVTSYWKSLVGCLV